MRNKVENAIDQLLEEEPSRTMPAVTQSYNKALKGVKISIPAFTITSDVRISKYDYPEGERRIIAQPIGVSLDTFENDIEQVLDQVVPAAIATAIQGQIELQMDTGDVYVGGHSAGFPKEMNFGEAGA